MLYINIQKVVFGKILVIRRTQDRNIEKRDSKKTVHIQKTNLFLTTHLVLI